MHVQLQDSSVVAAALRRNNHSGAVLGLQRATQVKVTYTVTMRMYCSKDKVHTLRKSQCALRRGPYARVRGLDFILQ